VLPIGGLKEKVLAAYRADIKVVVCPVENEKDLNEVPKHVFKAMEFRFVDTIDEVLRTALAPLPDDHPNQALREFLVSSSPAKPDAWREVKEWLRQRKEREENARAASGHHGPH
jgi:ATP-dependent Lon protease